MSSLLGKVDGVHYDRERLELPDGDFLDLDWIKKGSQRLVILSSGMEGNSERHYIKSTAKYFSERGWDVLAWNYRGCSGELNRLAQVYSYADTYDLSKVISHVIEQKSYEQIALIGFSMGGCLVTKYLGENPSPDVVASVTFSVSCDLKDSMREVEKSSHFVYNQYFLSKLRNKLKLKAKIFKEIRVLPIDKIVSFDDYIKIYSIPFHGFKDVRDFYGKSSCNQFIPNLRVPSLMVNALNDPILGDKCYPYELARDHAKFYLETPTTGGHLGFLRNGPEKDWMPERAFEFIASHLPEP
ncbi:MAG: alpha/beta fold hydrolase [Cyclobacteriaceae bacterium]